MKIRVMTSLIAATTVVWATESTLVLRHRESQGVGYSKGYSSLDYLLTAQGKSWEFLFDLRGHMFNDGRAAGNAGIGFRRSLGHDHSRVGMNLFYDVRDYRHFFAHQIGGGLEWISRSVDVRFNGYLPVGDRHCFKRHLFREFQENLALVRRKFSAALPCLEGEVGTALADPFYFAVGSYYLFPERHSLQLGKAWGGRARMDIEVSRYVCLGAIATYDAIFKTRVQGYLALHIPLGRGKETPSTSRNLRRVPIVRNEIIPIQTKTDRKVPMMEESGQTVRFIFVNNQADGQGSGTFESPFNSLKEAERNSSPGDIIYVYPGDGTPRAMDEGIVLQDRQRLASAGVPLVVEDLEVPAQTPGLNPTITNKHEDQPVVVNPGESELDDFYIIPWKYFGFSSVSATVPSSGWDAPSLQWVDLRRDSSS